MPQLPSDKQKLTLHCTLYISNLSRAISVLGSVCKKNASQRLENIQRKMKPVLTKEIMLQVKENMRSYAACQ